MRIALLLSMAVCAQAQTHVIAVNVDGVIHPVTVEIVGHAIDEASRDNAAAVLLRLNTPGGLIDASREIAAKIEASRVPVIAYVTPSGGRAASAGFFLLEASDVAAMAPGTNTGASSPVLLNGEMDQVMRNKVENDTSAWLRSTVLKRGRNVELAETTVREAKAFSDKEALDGRLIDRIEPDERALLNGLDGMSVKRFDGSAKVLHTRGAEVVEYQKTLREKIVYTIADPNIGFILLVLGVLGIYVEFSAPGLIFPGIAGGILALLGLSSLAVLPINWAGAALLVLGVSLFVLEAKFASHGILGIGGTTAMVLGAMLLIDGPPEMRIHLSTALAVSIPFALITMFLVTLVIRARRNKAVMGSDTLINQIAEARTALSPSGTVFLQGEYWNAESEVPVEKGGRVRVVSVEGLKLHVSPVAK
jgi:membrane-bound serine protease (ClpP class)